MSLILAKPQTWVSIKSVSGPEYLAVRLAELGFVVGAEVRVVGKALFGSPLFIEVKGAVLALRENEALCIQV